MRESWRALAHIRRHDGLTDSSRRDDWE